MARSFSELAERYADMQGARAAWFLPAAGVADAMAKLGLIGPCDRLVACRGDGEEALRAAFRPETLRFADEPTPGAFAAASEAPAVGEESASDVLPDGSAPQAHASYAHASGACVDRLFWLVGAVGACGLRVPDLRALARAAQANGAILIVDDTLPTSFGCRPLGLGAHIAMEELGCGIVGLSLAPSVAGKGRHRRTDPIAEEAYLLLAMRLGQGERGVLPDGIAAALDAGMDALASRMQRAMDGARALAEYLACHPSVPRVCYPGLSSHIDHDVATVTLAHGFGPVVEFELSAAGSAQALASFCEATCRRDGTGGVPTRFSARERAGARIVRIEVGEDDPLAVADILDQALRMFC